MDHYEVAVIGAGIAGASIAARIAKTRRTIILEMEDRPGYHTTGRSASAYEPNYGPPPILALIRASGAFLKSPPDGFAGAPLFTPRGSLFLEAEGQQEETAQFLKKSHGLSEISETQALEFYPVLQKGYAKRIFWDRDTGDLDVDLVHRGFLKMAKSGGAVLAVSSPVRSLEADGSAWTIALGDRKIKADIIVNAAGAWGDVVGQMAGARPVGLVPKRRSIAVIPVDASLHSDTWPMVSGMADTWYSKPQSGKLLVSPADMTPVEPHDAYADDMAIAEGIERFMAATTIKVERVEHSWGGLRSFVADGNPVVGFDPKVERFFWLVGQGGYGIETSPALSDTAAAMLLDQAIPNYILEEGFDPKKIPATRASLP